VFAALYVRGELARLAHDSKTALTLFERAVAVHADPHALFKLATVARDLGHDDDARRYLQRIQ
jgi:TolA-binding protein